MQFNKQFLIFSIVLVALFLLSWKIAADNDFLKGDGSTNDGSAKTELKNKMSAAHKSLDKRIGGKETPLSVEAEPALMADLIQTVSAQGRVYSYQNVDLNGEISGRLTEILVKDGSQVKKGQVIARIDAREYRLAFEEAQSAYLTAKADLLNFDKGMTDFEKGTYTPEPALVALEEQKKKGLVSEQDYRAKKLTLELNEMRDGKRRNDVIAATYLDKAEVALDRGRLNLEKCEIKAPVSGHIYELEVSEGTLINGATKIAKLVNMSNLVVKATVLESEIGKIQEGRAAVLNFTALPHLGEVTGHVQSISPLVDEINKTVVTVIRFKSTDDHIKPGMYAEATIDASIFKDKLMVPKLAILPRDNRKVLFKVSEENRAKWIYVDTGVENDHFVEILSNEVQPGDMVLTDNHYTMGHDTLVKIVKKK